MIERIRNMPLRYRLSIAFFILAFIGTISLVALAIHSQNRILEEEERKQFMGYHRALDHNIESAGLWALSLAASYARNPEIASALARQDRSRLIELCYPAYLFMRENYEISQFNFHTVPPRNFLRFQRLYEFGDELGYRQTIRDAVSRKKGVHGIESGLTGFGIRGVAPVLDEGELVGTVEVGFSLGNIFLKDLKKQFGVEASFLLPTDQHGVFKSLSTTLDRGFTRRAPVYEQVFSTGEPAMYPTQIHGDPYTVWVRTVRDYSGQIFGMVEFYGSRRGTLDVLAHYRRIMLGVGLLGMLLSVAGIYIISAYFTKPIGKMVTFAREIAVGKLVAPLSIRPGGELMVLRTALNDMLTSLQESRTKIREYTENLEEMIQVRTRALLESEEKYRTLVENVPLVVYRLLNDGRTIFINHFVQEFLGLVPEDITRDRDFWKEKVVPEDRPDVWPLMDRCLVEGREFKAEYRVIRPDGRLLHVLDHAIPVFDEAGRVETVDGFLVNVSDRHRLQQQIIQTEELKTLSEVSARLAHEIRNPLVAAGGFARRLAQSLPEGDPQIERAKIVVKEVARLEKILEQTLAYLRELVLAPVPTVFNDVVREVIEEVGARIAEKGVLCHADLSEGLPRVALDRPLFKRALGSILEGLLDHCSGECNLHIRTFAEEGGPHLEARVSGAKISKDDVDHFFYPFRRGADHAKILDLPVAKMIVHKHGGLVDLRRKGDEHLVLNISFPR